MNLKEYDEKINALAAEIEELKRQRNMNREHVESFFVTALEFDGVRDLVVQVVSVERASGWTCSRKNSLEWEGFRYAIKGPDGVAWYEVQHGSNWCSSWHCIENRMNGEFHEIDQLSCVIEEAMYDMGLEEDAECDARVYEFAWLNSIRHHKAHVAVAMLLSILHEEW